MQYHDALQWIHSLYRFGSKPGLGRIEHILRGLGNPHHRLRTIHIAGTNGKGSTAAMLASMLEAEGCRTGLYTSPYMESFTNRMAVDGEDINQADLAKLVSQIRPLVEEAALGELGQPTEFEVVTALAFAYFAGQNPDWVVVEVGLGGRLDATNVIVPEVSVITNIGLDHMQVLGDTVEAIAFEKAGIIKEGVPVVTAAQKPEALSVITEVARKRGAPLTVVDRDVKYTSGAVTIDGQAISYSGRHRLEGLHVPLPGRHQARNAATALAARELLPDPPFNEEAVRAGLSRTRWPGRLEVFCREPLIIVDGAHNADGILALRQSLGEMLGGRALHLVLGILGDKAVDEILGLIVPLATAGLIITRPDNPRAADPRDVAGLASRYTDLQVRTADNVNEAVALALSSTLPGEALCISGSLYTISEARQSLKKLLGSS